ncbi:hypothetical protein C8R47DRAFT_15404 [Mycena vitilis]|nr:hypothetical protein C8R47DRAFT_15404 [Mycena vitilis]
MLALCFWPLLGLPLTYASTTVLSVSDPSLVFSPGWTQEFSQATQDSFLQTNSFGGALTVTLPRAASSVDYVGFLTAGGSMYGYTLDCEEDCVLQTVNGSDPSVTNDTTAAQSTIFSLDLDPSIEHTLSVYNIPSDSPDGSSQINFNNLNVNIQDDAGAVPGALTVYHRKPLLTVPARRHRPQHQHSVLVLHQSL